MPTINPQAVRGPVTAIPVVAGTGVRFVEDVPNNRVVAELDETVLYTSDTGGVGITLSESPMNFERLKVFYGTPRTGTTAGANIGISFTEVLTSTLEGGRQGSPSAGYLPLVGFFYGNNSTQATPYLACAQYTGCNTTSWTRGTKGMLLKLTDSTTSETNQWTVIYKVVGINRISASA